MTADHRSKEFHYVRSQASVIVYPLQELVNWPIKTIHWIVSEMRLQHHLMEDNARLRAHELLLEAKLQKLLALEQENAQLRQLLASRTKISGRVSAAQLMAVDLNPYSQQVILDKGGLAHVYVGQPVLDAYGVMGQVVNVDPLTSRLMLITDTRSAIPVQDNRNGIRAIAVGLGRSNELALINVPDTTDIQQGDLFVTSGLGLRYPIGYPVGVVFKVRHLPGKRFALILLQPSAHLNRTQQVLLVWPNTQAISQAAQAELNNQLPQLNSPQTHLTRN